MTNSKDNLIGENSCPLSEYILYKHIKITHPSPTSVTMGKSLNPTYCYCMNPHSIYCHNRPMHCL